MRALTTLLLTVVALSASAETIFTSKDIYVAKYRDDKACAISYTFDDGYLDHYTKIFPKFQELDLRGTFWLNGKAIEERDKEALAGNPRLKWSQVKEMSDAGQEMSNHSWSHPHLKELPLDEVRIEIEKNDSIILANTGRKPITFCYPFTGRTPEIIAIAMEGKVGTRLKQKPIGQDKNKCTDESLNAWMDSVIASGAWESAMIHGITCSFDYFHDIDVLWRHFERAKANEDKIWIDTFAAVSAYIAERDALQLDMAQKESRKRRESTYIISPKVDPKLNPNLYDEPLTMVIKLPSGNKISVMQSRKPISTTDLGDRQIFNFTPHGGDIHITLLMKN